MRLFGPFGLVAQSACLVLVGLTLSACASAVPPSRIGSYMGQQAVSEPAAAEALPQTKIRAGLVLIPDTTAPDAAPALPEGALAQMAERLQEQFNQFLPVAIDKVLAAEGIQPRGDVSQFIELGKKHGVDYLAVVVVSSTEQEYPVYVFLGWTAHMQPGLRRDNWSLVEVVVLDVKSGKTVVNAEGRGWATLDRPTAPGINQWYPVIWRRPQDPNWRWWPPTFESAPHTLRVISMHEAVKRLVINLQDAWIQKRQAELTSTRG